MIHHVDPECLRLGRLARLQQAMVDHDVDALVLANEPNVRYATGATAMPVYAMSTFVRCAVVPREGTPILFEHANSVHRSAVRAPDVRPMHAWEFYDDPAAQAAIWADETLAAIVELGAEVEPEAQVLAGEREPAEVLAHLLGPGPVAARALVRPDALDHTRHRLHDLLARSLRELCDRGRLLLQELLERRLLLGVARWPGDPGRRLGARLGHGRPR